MSVITSVARKVPAPVAVAFHEVYAHIGLVWAVLAFAFSQASQWSGGPAWIAEVSGVGLFVIGKFSSARVPASFGAVLAVAEKSIPQIVPVVAQIDQAAATVAQVAPAVEALAPAAAPVVAQVEHVAAALDANGQPVAQFDANGQAMLPVTPQ